jgi:hypothetical protein
MQEKEKEITLTQMLEDAKASVCAYTAKIATQVSSNSL